MTAKGRNLTDTTTDLTGNTIVQTKELRMDRLRTRAAWMYYIEQMTQNDIATVLGVGRVTIVRLLAEARARNEVKITIDGALAELVDLERQLEEKFGLQQAIVAPVSVTEHDPINVIAAATGRYLSENMRHGMRVGVGWGRTLYSTLSYIDARPLNDLTVVSLLGGISQPRRFNPTEFAWQFAETFNAEGYLIPAPALVDSSDTKRALIEHCGLHSVFQIAEDLDMVLLSVGNIDSAASSYRMGHISEAQRDELVKAGAVGDLLYHFYGVDGQLINHPIQECVMSVNIEVLQKTPQRILSSGGAEKAAALLGGMRLLKPTVFITDELCAAKMLELAR